METVVRWLYGETRPSRLQQYRLEKYLNNHQCWQQPTYTYLNPPLPQFVELLVLRQIGEEELCQRLGIPPALLQSWYRNNPRLSEARIVTIKKLVA